MQADLSARDLWRSRVDATPERDFLVVDEGTLSFGEADAAMLRFAGGLAALGIGPLDRVLVALPNGARAVLVHAALRELGAIVVPVLPGLPLPELAFQAEHCRAPTLIAEDPIASLLLPELDSCPTIETIVVPRGLAPASRRVERFDLEAVAAHGPLSPGLTLPGHEPDSPMAILYTSGSTGRPKGVVLPSGALANAGHDYSTRFGVGAADNVLVATPIAHAVGALTKPGMALVQGCRMTIVDRFSPSRFWADVERSGSTATVLFPAQLNLLLQIEGGPAPGASTLRLIMTHAWNAPFRERFGVDLGLCWGMTETGGVGAATPPGWLPGPEDEGAVGPPMDSVEVSIRDGHGAEVGPGAEGELWTHNPHRMLGYLDDPEATAATLVDGWIRSGDRGRVDDRGFLFYGGRIKNMIKRSGENISPLEVEAALELHPDVTESVVLGIDDALRGEEVVAIVVLRPGAAADLAAIAAHAEGHLARWKLPRWTRADSEPLPRLPNGKIDRLTILADLDLDVCRDARAVNVD